MDDRVLISLLQSLAQLDIDACHGYRRALQRLGENTVRVQLTEFLHDHERHVDALSEEIRRLGGAPPEFERDAAGVMIEGMTALRSLTGGTGALKALKTNEHLTNAAYAAALKEDLPAGVRHVLSEHREDERRHLAFIREALERPEHRGPALGTVLAGAALVTAGAAAAVWAISRRRGAERAPEAAPPQPAWLVRKAPPGARLADTAERDGMTDFGDEAQLQAPGVPPNLALHAPEGDRKKRERALDETTRNRSELP